MANLFTNASSLLMAAVSELIVAVAALVIHPNPAIAIWFVFGLLLLAVRLLLLRAAGRAVVRGLATPTDLLIMGSLVWAAQFSLGCILCDITGDPTLQVLANVCATALIGALIGRYAGTPRLAITQMTIALTLLCIGAVLAPQLWLRVMLIQAPLYAYGLRTVCLSINRELVTMLKAQRANAMLVRHDTLTNLPNRVHVNEVLDRLLADGGEQDHFAVIWVDLDGFKGVNDTLGHAVGDAVLIDAARRLRELCGPSEVVARLGGDEFVVIAPGFDREAAEALSLAIGVAMKAPYTVGDAVALRLDVSIGVSLFPEHGRTGDGLLIAADRALYAVKAAGKADFAVYDPIRHAGEEEMILFRTDLEAALSAGANQLELHYQPVTSLTDGRVTSREALVRWRHPVRGLVSPAAFIPLAEATGLIIPLGEWVLRQACADAVKWRDPVTVAVNVSPVQLRNVRLASVVSDALARTGLAAGRLEIEVTETVLLSDNDTTQQNMRRIRSLGIPVVLDDFGTGFSSLSNLCRFAFDRIKIDGSFVREALHRRECAAVVRATIQLARELDIPTTAECIETQEQLDFVRASGCSDVQGYLLGRPEPASAIALKGNFRSSEVRTAA